jgi:hypothetical protein
LCLSFLIAQSQKFVRDHLHRFAKSLHVYHDITKCGVVCISDAFVDLLGVNEIKEWKPVDESPLTEVTQLRIPLSDWSDHVD